MMHIQTQRNYGSTLKTCTGLSQSESQLREMEVDMVTHPIIKKLSSINTCWQMDNHLFSVESQLVYQLYSMAGSMLRSSWPT